jgi:hypothetical protein
MIRKIVCVNSILVILLSACFLIYPPIRAFLSLNDPALRGPGIPKVAWRLYRNLTPRYEAWARARVAGSQAASLSLENISGTEWPLFGSVFYLWGLENLQAAWDAGDHTGGVEPKVFAREAVVTASELVIDPMHASWVKKHWGDNYLHRENVFYRMLVISALTSRANLLHDNAHLDLLRDQVETFSSELDASPNGLLDDYPGECYPGDVVTAIAAIRRADAVLGTDHSQFIAGALRGFIGAHATKLQLPPYLAEAKSGRPLSTARGCANSYICLNAPELWPDKAKQWYALCDRFFWQHAITADGYREFPIGTPKSNWTMDVDAGPVIAGHGVSASAFGMGAARKNGRFDRAYPLAAEMLATAWELPNGVLAIPRLLSNAADAPLLGEASFLWLLTIQPEKGFAVKPALGGNPSFVYVVLVTALVLGTFLILESAVRFQYARREPEPELSFRGGRIFLWFLCFAGALVLVWTPYSWAALILFLLMLALPARRKKRPKDDWDKQQKAATQSNPPPAK